MSSMHEWLRARAEKERMWHFFSITQHEAAELLREYDELQARCDLRMASLKENVAPVAAEREIRELAANREGYARCGMTYPHFPHRWGPMRMQCDGQAEHNIHSEP